MNELKPSTLKTITALALMILTVIVSCEKEIDSYFPTSFSDDFPVKARLGKATDITAHSATIPFTLKDIGSNTTVKMYLCYSDTTWAPTIKTEHIFLGEFSNIGDSISKNIELSNLNHKSNYSYRAYCEIPGKDTAYSYIQAFSTPLNEKLPVVNTEGVQFASLNSAILHGKVISVGESDELLEHGFVLGDTPKPTIKNKKINVGPGNVGSFSFEPKDLKSESKYYCRAYAINKYGVEYGEERMFYTSRPFKLNFGGVGNDLALSIQQTYDGGFIVCGMSDYPFGDSINYHGEEDGIIMKLHPNGKVQWQQFVGGPSDDVLNSIRCTSDGGYFAVGGSKGGISGSAVKEKHDAYAVKLDKDGRVEWQNTYGGSYVEIADAGLEVSTGGYIITASTQSNDGDIAGYKGGTDYWVVKISESGEIEWSKTYGGSSADLPEDIIECSDGSFVIAGASASEDGDVSFTTGTYDYWIIKIDANGELLWEKSFGRSGRNWAKEIKETDDKGYIVTGSFNNTIYVDYYTIKLDINGNLIWESRIGGQKNEWPHSVIQNYDGNYVIAGSSSSDNWDVSQNFGGKDVWVVKMNGETILWEESFGGSDDESANSIIQTHDGSYIMAGYSKSQDGDITEYKGNEDCWIIHFYEDEISQ